MAKREIMTLDEYVEWPQEFIVSGGLDEVEMGYKLRIAQSIAKARAVVLEGASDWVKLVKRGYDPGRNNLVEWRATDVLFRWFKLDPVDALDAMQALWAEDDTPIPDRIREFIPRVPENPKYPKNFRGPGTRLRLTAALLMALDPWKYPPFKVTEFKNAYKVTGQDGPLPGADEADMYEYALGFLDRIVERAAALGFDRPCNRLEAQSIVWSYRYPGRFVPKQPGAAGGRAS